MRTLLGSGRAAAGPGFCAASTASEAVAPRSTPKRMRFMGEVYTAGLESRLDGKWAHSLHTPRYAAWGCRHGCGSAGARSGAVVSGAQRALIGTGATAGCPDSRPEPAGRDA